LLRPIETADPFWRGWFSGQDSAHRAEIFSAADRDEDVRVLALIREAITVADALAMPGGLTTLATIWPVAFEGFARGSVRRLPCLVNLADSLIEGVSSSTTADATAAIGRHLLCHKMPPWIRGRHSGYYSESSWLERVVDELVEGLADNALIEALDEAGKLGVTAILCLLVELGQLSARDRSYYVALPGLAIPADFREIFRDWAAGRVNFVEFVDGEPAG